MKRQIIIIVMLFTVNLLSAQTKVNTLVGKWIGTDERNETAGIEFNENGKAKLLLYGKEMPFEYKANYAKDPITITFTAKPKGKILTMYGLIKFIDSDTLKWELFPMADKQPYAFSKNPVGTSIILNRSKE